MSPSFDLDRPTRFAAGALGPPGGRVFYLQGEQDGRLVSLKLEKQQVAALCDYLAGILDDLPTVAPEPAEAATLAEPVVPEWVVGSLAVGYEQADDHIVLVAEELVEVPDDADPVAAAAAAVADPATARFHLRLGQVAAFIEHARQVVEAGRPTCPLCLAPMDPDGHICPRLN